MVSNSNFKKQFGMIFSKLHFKNLTTTGVLLFFVIQYSLAQKTQKIAYINMEYILESVPEYRKAQQSLNDKVVKWRGELDKLAREIEKLKTDLSNEREILTADIILEKEDEIQLKQKELRKLEEKYFGASGDMYTLRRRIIYPVQDLVYNAIEGIAKRYKYDFVLDKSSDLIMLYSNKKYDISELVLRSIGINRKRNEKLGNKVKTDQKKALSDAQKKKLQLRIAAQKKKEADNLAKKKKIEDARKKRKAAIEAKRALLSKKKEEAKKKKEEDKKQEENNN